MACIIKPECNFLHGYFRCLLPIETMDIKVKIKMMRGIQMFKRDISCNTLSARLHTYPSLIRKMKNYLELEGKCGNQLSTNIFLPDKNSLPRKTLVPKRTEKKKRAKVPVKRRFKVRVISQPMPTNPTLPVNPMPSNPTLPVNPTLPTNPTPTADTTMATSTQTSVTRPVTATAKSIPVTVYNLAQGKFKGIPYPTRSSQEEEGPSLPSGDNPLRISNPKLQPHKPERTPHDQIPCWPLQTYLLKGHHGQSPYNGEVPTPTFVKTERAEKTQPNRQLSPMLWC